MKTHVISIIRSCKTLDQLSTAKNYAKLAGLSTDTNVMQWLRFKRMLIKY